MGNGGSQAKFKLDHTLDEMREARQSSLGSSLSDDRVSIISKRSRNKASEDDVMASILETPEEKKSRKRSHWVVYATTLNVSIGFSIVLTGVYPYLKQLENEPNLSKTKSGWVIAANPLGQLIASPLAGYMGNRLGSIRYVCYFTMSCFALGSLLYGMLPALDELWDHSAFHLMILARFIVGLSSSNITLCRSYVAASTTLSERTKAISLVSASQALGFIIGPALQVLLSLAIENDMTKYRSTGFVAAIMAVGNFFLFNPWVFKEFNIAAKERALAEKNNPGLSQVALPKIDYVALGSILLGFFLVQFVYVLVESLMEPFVQDQYAWCDDMAVIVVGVALMVGGLLTIFMFLLSARLARIMDERKILTRIGFVFIITGVFLFLPWGSNELIYCGEEANIETSTFQTLTSLQTDAMIHPLGIFDPVTQTSTYNPTDMPEWPTIPYEDRSNLFQKICGNTSECLGCPPEQDWCTVVPKLPLWQFFIAFFLIIGAYPFGASMSNAIYSKIIGPRPQGFWMGILTSSGSFARVLGPIFVSYVYSGLGTRYTFGILVVAMSLGLVQLLINYKRIVPMKVLPPVPNDKF